MGSKFVKIKNNISYLHIHSKAKYMVFKYPNVFFKNSEHYCYQNGCNF